MCTTPQFQYTLFIPPKKTGSLFSSVQIQHYKDLKKKKNNKSLQCVCCVCVRVYVRLGSFPFLLVPVKYCSLPAGELYVIF